MDDIRSPDDNDLTADDLRVCPYRRIPLCRADADRQAHRELHAREPRPARSRDGRPDRAAGRHQRHLGRAVPAQRRLPQPRRPEARTARRRRPPVDDHRPARRIPPRRRHASGRTRRQRPRGPLASSLEREPMRSATCTGSPKARCSRRWPTGSRRRTPCSSSASSRRAGSATRSAATSNTCARACSIRTASRAVRRFAELRIRAAVLHRHRYTRVFAQRAPLLPGGRRARAAVRAGHRSRARGRATGRPTCCR